MQSNAIIALLLLLLADAAQAGATVSDISGPLNEAEINLAIATRQNWLERADNNCISKSLHGCDITLNIQIPASGKPPLCEIERTVISSTSISSLYCTVMTTISFPRKPAATSFTLAFSKDTPSQTSGSPIKGAIITSQGYVRADIESPALPPCPGTTGARDSESIRQCFDQYGGRLNNLYQWALRNDPLLTGSLKMAIKIEADGTVSEVAATVESGYFDKVFIEQSIEVIKSMNFGKASERKEMTHTLNFFPS